MAFVTDSNRPQPLWQPTPTAYPTASTATSVVPSLLCNPGLDPYTGAQVPLVSGELEPTPVGAKMDQTRPSGENGLFRK